MNVCKRIAALLLALCLVIQLVPASAGAAETGPSITVSDAEIYPGSGGYIYVAAAGLSSLASLDLEIYYDSDVLTLSRVYNGTLLNDSLASVNNDTPGVLKLSAAWLAGVSGSGRLLRLYFEAKSDAPAGSQRILAAVGDAHDKDLNHVSMSGDTGTVTVLKRPDTLGKFSTSLSFPDGATFSQGDSFTVSLCGSWNYFASADFVLEYDSDLLELQSVQLRNELTVEGAVYSINTDISGLVRISYASVSEIYTYYLADCVFKVREDVDASTPLTFRAADVYSIDLIPYEPGTATRTITLKKAAAVPDYPDLWLTELPTTVGQEGEAYLMLQADSRVAAADFTLRYDPQVYACLEVTAAEELSQNGGMAVVNPAFDEGTIRFSYINEKGSEKDLPLLKIRWKCLSSPGEHTQVKPSGSGVVNDNFVRVNLDYVIFTDCIFDSFHMDPSCTVEGGDGLMCSACGEKKDVTVIPATGHHYGAAVTPPTCTAEGFTTYTCPDCGHSYVDAYTDATGHSYGDWYAEIPSTCTETGIRRHDCRSCDHFETEVTEALGHSYENGTCVNCGAPESYLEEGKCGDMLYWRMGTDGTLTVFGYGAMYDYSGTSPWDAYKDSITKVAVGEGATTIGRYAFYDCTAITEVSLPDTLQTLCNSCFNYCSGLKSVELAGDLKSIENYAFGNCENLESVTLPEGLETIGSNAFSSCRKLKGIVIPETVTSMGSYVFSNCGSLEYANIPEGITTLGSMIFYYCRSLKEIGIPESVEIIDTYAFSYCSSLTVVTVPAGVTKVGNSAFYNCSALKEVYVYSTDCVFGSNVFTSSTVVLCYEGSTAYTYAVENGITYCASPAGQDLGHVETSVVTAPTCLEQGYTTHTCSRCGYARVDSYTDPAGHTYENGSCVRCGAPESYLEEGKCGDTLYWRMGTDGTLTIFGTGAMYDYYSYGTSPWIGYKDSITRVVVQEGATTVGNYAFYNHTAVTEVSLPDTLQSVGSYALYNCSALRVAYVCSQDCTINEWAFPTGTIVMCYEDSTARAYAVQNGLTYCASPVGQDLGHAETPVVTAPTCTEQGYTTYTCSRCGYARVDSYTDPTGHSYENGICVNCGAPESFVEEGKCGDSLYWRMGTDGTMTIFGTGAMYDYSSGTSPWNGYKDTITKVVVEEGATTIGSYAFNKHAAITEVSLPDTLQTLEDSAFSNCDGLTAAELPGNLKKIAGSVFSGCDNLESVNLPEGLETIGDNAFSSCGALKGIVIPDTVTEIGNYAFSNCYKLEYANIPESLTKLNTMVFFACRSLKEIVIPEGVTEIGKYAFEYCDALTSVVIPESVEIVKQWAFYQCAALEEIYIYSADCSIEGESLDLEATIFCYEGSTAHSYAEENGLAFCAAPEGEELGHVNTSVVTAPTCTEQGYTTHTCSRCAGSYVDSYVDALGHSYGDWYTVTEPGCTTTGTERRNCVRCDASEEQTVEKLGHDYVPEVTDPTCTEQGYTTHTCSRCADSYVDTYVAALGHSYGDWYTVTEPGCTSTGTDRRDCERCDAFEQRAVSELGHSYQTVVTAPTCLDRGYTTHTCSRCADTYVDSYVAALGHDYGVWITDEEATCTEQGSAHRECSRCDSVERKSLEALGHDYAAAVTAPTCTERGYTTHTCSRCSDSYVDTPVAALGHSYGDWYTVTDPSCTQEGLERRDCIRCDAYEQQAVSGLGHDYRAVVTAPTCLDRGYTTHTCSRCSDTYVDSYVDALGHDYGAWITDREASCTEDGSAHRECSRCDSEESQTLAMLGHAYKAAVTAPTCTEEGYTTHTCSRCADSYVDERVAALGHDYGDWITDKDASCTEDGSAHRSCSRGDSVETEVLPMLGHDYRLTVTEPACLDKGYTTHTCSRCSDSYVDAYVDALGHDYGDWYTVTEPGCTTTGTDRRDCGRCDAYEQQTVSALGHDYDSVVTAPTCTEQGYTTHTCSRCTDSYVDSYVDALGHAFGDWITDKDATCTEDGSAHRSCSRCDSVEKKTLEELGHDYAAAVTAPTCLEQGYTTHSCSRCGHSYVDAYVEALGHDFGEWYTVTGATCTEDGSQRRDCGRCAHFESRVAEKLGHAYASVVTAPTCTAQGYTTHTCSRCADSYVDSYMAALGHDYGEWITDQEATCTEDGSAHRDCSRCDSVDTKVLSKLGHDYKAAVTEPTCTEEGYTTHICSRCADSYVDVYVEALGHDFGEWYTVTGATCTEDGSQRRDCGRCAHFETRVAEKLGHDYASTVTAPTCTAQGYTTHTCSRCSDSYVDTYVDAMGHDYGSWITDKEATCTEDGSAHRECSRCDSVDTKVLSATGHMYSSVVTAPDCLNKGYTTHTCVICGHSYVDSYVDALGHDYQTEVTEPTCLEQGYTTYTCSRCDHSYTDDYVAPKGHDMGSWSTVTEADCLNKGQESRKCRNCDYREYRDTDALGHDYDSVVTAPTCTEEGYTTHTCRRCGHSYVDAYVEALGHAWDQGVVTREPTEESEGEMRYTCTRCGETKTEVIPELEHVHQYSAVTTAPTCTAQGYTTYTCRCGDSYKEDYVDALGHDYASVVTAPTCTEAGYTTHTCTRCADSYVDANKDALGHDYGEWITEREATCTEDGSAHRDCSRCDSVETKILPKLDHAYDAVLTAPTCTERGYTTHTCGRCGHSYVDSYVAALGHDYHAVVTEPTCLEQGYTTYTCSRCKDSYVDTYVAALGHDYGDWITDKAATCTEDGSAHRDCSRCDSVETKVLTKLGHAYEVAVTEPTCTERGYTTHTCGRCGHSYVDGYVEALGHDYGEWITDKAAACTEDGSAHRDCSRCDSVETKLLPATGHSYTDSVTPPDCVNRGYTTHTCGRCGHSYVDSYVDALGHDYGEWITDREASCTEDGSAHRDCSRCDSVETKLLPVTGHSYTDSVIPPDCVNRGYTTHTCGTCGHSYVDSYVDALGHDYGEWITDEEATCTEDGSAYRDCSRCDSVETKALSATGHKYASVITAPDCLNKGYTTHTCGRCGHSYVDSYVDALGHAYGEWITDREASCTEDGSAHRECVRCDSVETKVLTKLDHAYDAVVTAPTCTERGYTTHTCGRCGHSYADRYVDALGHDYGEWITDREASCTEDGSAHRDCSRCDSTETRVLSKLGHVYEEAVTAPTCTERGYTTHACRRCGHSYVDTYVAALGHDYGSWITDREASCTEDGSAHRECVRCGHMESKVLPELGHAYKAVVTAPTCTEEGYTTHTCSRCADTFVDELVDALGHAYGDWITDREASCTEDGSAHRSCSRCGDAQTKVLPKLSHAYEAVVAAPTCTDQGYTTYTCSRCKDSYVDTYVAALGHDYGGWITDKAASCTEDGRAHRDCSRCDSAETKVLPATGHSYTDSVTPPTCTDQGYTTHTCHCGDSYVDTYVAALGHDWDEGTVITEPTEEEPGERRYTCRRCGETKTEIIPELGHTHDYTASVTAPTCTERGYTTYACRCGDSYKDNYVDALGHSFGDWYTAKAPSCTADGEEHRDCERCGHIESRVMTRLGHDYVQTVTAPTCLERGYTTYSCSRCDSSYTDHYVDALGHEYVSVATAPTCTEGGYTTHTCSRCSDTYTDAPTEALGHSWDEGVVTKEPTEEQAGEMLHTCLRCGETKTEVIPPLEHTHSYTAEVTAPTCTEPGYTTCTCRCGHSYTDHYVAELGHAYGAWETVTEATCTADGEEGRVCGRCGHKESRVLTRLGHDHTATATAPTCTEQGYTTYTCRRCDDSYVGDYVDALGHDYGSVVTAPTCTEGGYTTHICDRCGDMYTDTPTEALGHSWDEGVVKKEPTEEEPGERLHTCLRCNETKIEPIPVLGHTHSHEAVVTAPTCTEGGYTTFTCSCGDKYTGDETEPLGHAWDDGEILTEPTEETDGQVRYVCTRCGEIRTDKLPATGHTHSYSAVVTAPTCTEEGYTTYTCRCGDSYVADHVPELDHREEKITGREATCTVPGLTDGTKCPVCGEILDAQEEIPVIDHRYVTGFCDVCGQKDPGYQEPTEPTEPENPEQPTLSGVYRIAGADRIGTSLGIADQLKEALGVEKFNAVIVASALNFPDALTGSYLAAVKSAPILLTYEAAHPQIRAYIQENLVPGGTVYILGGEGAVSANFATGLSGFNVKRVAGSDRFGTNLAIMREAGVNASQPVLIATALNFADSLSASAAGLPMVLVYGSLREDQKEFLATTSRNFIIIGGTSAVSEDLEAELRAIGSVDRLAGAGRYQTSVMVAQRFVPDPDAAVLAYARNFPDGLCGGPLAYALNAPLILTDNYDPATADAYVQGITAGFVAGGSGLISDESVKEIFDLAAGAAVPLK